MYLFAQAEGASSAAAGGDHNAFMNFLLGDPFFAVLLLGMTLTAATLVIWRIILNFNFKTDMNQFLPRFQDVLNKEGVDGAIRFCKAQPASEGIPRKLFVAGLENAKQGLAAMRRAMLNVMDMEILPDLNFLLTMILAIAKIATMVGLLATIISMIGTFDELGKAASSGGGGQAAASSKIGLALFGTMFGLITAIPLVFAHVLFKAWIHKQELKMKSSMQKLLLLVQANKAQATAAPAAAAGRPAAAPVAARAPAGG